jgi:hypothetical protein
VEKLTEDAPLESFMLLISQAAVDMPTKLTCAPPPCIVMTLLMGPCVLTQVAAAKLMI